MDAWLVSEVIQTINLVILAWTGALFWHYRVELNRRYAFFAPIALWVAHAIIFYTVVLLNEVAAQPILSDVFFMPWSAMLRLQLAVTFLKYSLRLRWQ